MQTFLTGARLKPLPPAMHVVERQMMTADFAQTWKSATATQRVVYISIAVVAVASVVCACVLVTLAIVESVRDKRVEAMRKELARYDQTKDISVSVGRGVVVRAKEFAPEASQAVVTLVDGVQADVVSKSGTARLLYAHGLISADTISGAMMKGAESILCEESERTCALEAVAQRARNAMGLSADLMHRVQLIRVTHASEAIALECVQTTCPNDATASCGCVAHACIFLTEIPNEEHGGHVIANDNGNL